MKDALKLAAVLAHAAKNGVDDAALKKLLADYQTEMLERGLRAVRASRGRWRQHEGGDDEVSSWGKKATIISDKKICLDEIPMVSLDRVPSVH